MRDNRPGDWAAAIEFDHRIRKAYEVGQEKRGALAGSPYLHRQMVPLEMADLTVVTKDRRPYSGKLLTDFECSDGICGT